MGLCGTGCIHRRHRHPKCRQAALHAQDLLVFAEQRRAMRDRQIDKLLIIWILARVDRPRRHGLHARESIKPLQHIAGLL